MCYSHYNSACSLPSPLVHKSFLYPKWKTQFLLDFFFTFFLPIPRYRSRCLLSSVPSYNAHSPSSTTPKFLPSFSTGFRIIYCWICSLSRYYIWNISLFSFFFLPFLSPFSLSFLFPLSYHLSLFFFSSFFSLFSFLFFFFSFLFSLFYFLSSLLSPLSLLSSSLLFSLSVFLSLSLSTPHPQSAKLSRGVECRENVSRSE